MIDKLDLWIGTLIYYLEKIMPYLLVGMIMNIIIQLIGG
jgi:hypothetical protein